MANRAVTKLKLDTDQANRDLRELAREGEATTGRVNRKAQNAGPGGATFGKGFGAGAGFALGKRIAGSVGFFSSIGDVMNDALSGVQADVDYSLGAQMSRAKSAARAETVDRMAQFTYHAGNTDAAKQVYNTMLRHRHLPQQEGAAKIMKAIGGARGIEQDLRTPFDNLTSSIVDELKRNFDRLLEVLGSGD